MKKSQNTKHMIRALCALLLVSISLSLCSCLSLAALPFLDISPDGENNGSFNDWFENEGEEEGTVSKPNVGKFPDTDSSDNDINVEVDDSGDVRYAAAKALLSSVIVIGSSRQGAQSAGSGVIYKLDKEKGNALIITNYHVIYDGSNKSNNYVYSGIDIYLYGSENTDMAVSASYVGGSMYYDLAVLYVENSDIIKNCNARAVNFADSDLLRAGQTVMAIGNPENGGVSVSKGIISVDSEYITMTAVDNKTSISLRVLRVDAAVNSGNSGGGLFDAKGDLVGIVNAKIVESGVESIGYAIPANVAKAITENILYYCSDGSHSSVMRAIIGVTVQATSSYAYYNEQTGLVDIIETIEVVEVASGSVSSNVIRQGDIIKSITVGSNTKAITRQFHVIDMMLDARPGDTVTVTVIRNGSERDLALKITESCLTEY